MAVQAHPTLQVMSLMRSSSSDRTAPRGPLALTGGGGVELEFLFVNLDTNNMLPDFP